MPPHADRSTRGCGTPETSLVQTNDPSKYLVAFGKSFPPSLASLLLTIEAAENNGGATQD